MKIYNTCITILLVFTFIFGTNKLLGQKLIRVKEGVGIKYIDLGKPIKRNDVRKYGKYEIEYFTLPIKPRTKSYRRKIYKFDSGLVFSTVKKQFLHRYRVSAIKLPIPLKAVVGKITLGMSAEEDILMEYGKTDLEYIETHEVDFLPKKGKLVKCLAYEKKGVKFYVDSVIYKIVVFKPEPISDSED